MNQPSQTSQVAHDSEQLRAAITHHRAGRIKQAESIYRAILQTSPDHPQALFGLGMVLYQDNQLLQALPILRRVSASKPENPEAYYYSGSILHRLGRLGEAETFCKHAADLHPDNATYKQHLDSVRHERRLMDEAINHIESNNTIPDLSFTESEISRNSPTLQQVNLAEALFKQFGVLVLRNIYSKSYIEELRNDYLTRYKEYFKDQEHPDALTVGNKRYMITVPLEGPYNNPHFYANPFLIPILGRILGFNFILGSIGSVASLPGSKAQHIHRDGPHLFDAECEGITPTYAVTAATPLVPLNKATGSTRVYRGTHLTTTALPKKTDVYLDPEADTGSCVIWDYRLFHGGLPNTSDNVRTIMYNVYSRDWFKDNKNYDKQAHLIIEDGEYDKIPDQFRRLVSWTRIPRSGRQS